MSNTSIRILSNLARAGGTLVSKCLGSMENTVLLSEIHPLGTQMFNPLAQARDWHQIDIDAGALPFPEAIRQIEEKCALIGKTLVLRDWAHLDYIGLPFIKNPGYRLQLTDTLAPHFNIIQYALVRHPIDQWISTSRLQIMQDQLDIDKFLAGYRRFAEQSAAGGFMRYEDFTSDPEYYMENMCRHLQLEFDARFIDHWYEHRHVTGDTSRQSRGSQSNTIKPLKRYAIGQPLLERFLNNADYCRAIELLGYENPPSTP